MREINGNDHDDSNACFDTLAASLQQNCHL